MVIRAGDFLFYFAFSFRFVPQKRSVPLADALDDTS
jgi:hypothetical protein